MSSYSFGYPRLLAHSLTFDSLTNFHTVCFLGQLKCTCYSCRGPGFGSQHPHSCSRWSNVFLCSRHVYTWCTTMQAKHSYTCKIFKSCFPLLIGNILGGGRNNLLIEMKSGLFYGVASSLFPRWLWSEQLQPLSLHAYCCFVHLRGNVYVSCAEVKALGHLEFIFFLVFVLISLKLLCWWHEHVVE